MAIPVEQIFAALRQAPAGMTTKQLANLFGAEPHAMSSRMSKLSCYGDIKCQKVHGHNGTPTHYAIWSLPQEQQR